MEKAFGKILLAFDDSEAAMAALQSAYGLSLKFQSQITVLVVSGKDTNLEESRKTLDQFARDKSLSMNVLEKEGALYDELIKLGKEGDYDVILIGSHGSSGWRKFWKGSNAFKVISTSTCPVISVTAKASSPELKNILLPIADSRNTRQKVPYCIALAKEFGSTVHIVGISKSRSKEVDKKVSSYVNQTANYLAEKGIKYTTKINLGVDVAKGCIAYAEEVEAGLILIMSETESSGLFRDSYSQQLVNHSTVPVMSIHTRDTRLAGAAGY